MLRYFRPSYGPVVESIIHTRERVKHQAAFTGKPKIVYQLDQTSHMKNVYHTDWNNENTTYTTTILMFLSESFYYSSQY